MATQVNDSNFDAVVLQSQLPTSSCISHQE